MNKFQQQTLSSQATRSIKGGKPSDKGYFEANGNVLITNTVSNRK